MKGGGGGREGGGSVGVHDEVNDRKGGGGEGCERHMCVYIHRRKPPIPRL